MANIRQSRQEIASGLRLAAWVLLTMVTLFLLFGGASIAFTPQEKLEFSNVFLAKVIAWVALLAGATIITFAVDRWVRALPGLLFLATLNGAVMTYTGHLINAPSLPIPRAIALASTLLLAATFIVSLHFRRRHLKVTDRIALLLFVATLVWASVSKLSVFPLSLGFTALLLAWARNRYLVHGSGKSGELA